MDRKHVAERVKNSTYKELSDWKRHVLFCLTWHKKDNNAFEIEECEFLLEHIEAQMTFIQTAQTRTTQEEADKIASLVGSQLPPILLASTDGTMVDLCKLGLTVIYIYPRISPADGVPLKGWDAIPGARGCTSQSCAFRDHFTTLRSLGVEGIFGMSTQTTDYQREAVERLHLPFPLLSDHTRILAHTLSLPTFRLGEMILMKRITFVIAYGKIKHICYPIAQPERNVLDVIAWLSANQLDGSD